MAQERKRRGPGFFDRLQHDGNARAFMRGNFAGLVLSCMVIRERASMPDMLLHMVAMNMIFFDQLDSFNEHVAFSAGFMWGSAILQYLFLSAKHDDSVQSNCFGPAV